MSRRCVVALAVVAIAVLLLAGQVGSAVPGLRRSLSDASTAAAAVPDPASNPPATPESEVAASVPTPVVQLPGPLAGQAAVDALGTHLGEVADANGTTADELTRVLTTDSSARIDTNLRLFYLEPALTGGPPPADQAAALPPLPAGADPLALNSRPGSTKTIYLDFDGSVVTGTGWNNQAVLGTGATFTNAPFDVDGSPTTFSSNELAMVNDIWARVSEDYAPFDVNVTTADPGAAAIDRSNAADQVYGTSVVISSQSIVANGCACGGIAFVGAFDVYATSTTPAHGFLQPAMVFQQSLLGSFTSSKVLAEAAAHEAGHTLGLDHDGTTTSAYYSGQGAWAPIMGTAYGMPLSQWSRGEYAGANNTQDDLAIIASNGPSLLADDHDDLRGGATALTSTATGVISSMSDVDWFTFEVTGTASATVSANPASSGPNVDIRLVLTDASGAVLATSDPPSFFISNEVASGLAASITRALPGGRYYVSVQGTGALDPATTGYSAYGSVGRYTVSAPPNSVPTCTSAPPGALAWWKGEGATTGQVGPALTGAAPFAPGQVGQGFNPTASSSLTLSGWPPVSSAVSVEAWVRPDRGTGRVLSMLSRWGSGARSADDVFAVYALQNGSNGFVSWMVDDPSTMWPEAAAAMFPGLFDGGFHHLAATYELGRLRLYGDGALLAERTVPMGSLTTTSSVPFRLFGPTGFSGIVDEAAVYGRALTAGEIQAVYLAGTGGKCP